jgi:hypothetical protein
MIGAIISSYPCATEVHTSARCNWLAACSLTPRKSCTAHRGRDCLSG